MIDRQTHRLVRDYFANQTQSPAMKDMHFVIISRNSKPNVYNISTVGNLADAEVIYCMESMKQHMILHPNH
jgi:hypothetical protein